MSQARLRTSHTIVVLNFRGTNAVYIDCRRLFLMGEEVEPNRLEIIADGVCQHKNSRTAFQSALLKSERLTNS